MGSIFRAAVVVFCLHSASGVIPKNDHVRMERVLPSSTFSVLETWKKHGKHNKAYSHPGSLLLGKIKRPESLADEVAEYADYLMAAAKSPSYAAIVALSVVVLVPIVTIISFLASKRNAQEAVDIPASSDAEDAEGLVMRAFSTAPILFEGKLEDKVWWYPPPMRMYSKRELLLDRIVNVSGAVLSWIGAPVLLHASYTAGDTMTQFVGFFVFCIGLVTMLTFSALFHSLSCHWRITRKLLYLDHIGIDAMIMGCYTPIAIHYGSLRILGFVLLLGTFGIFTEIAQFFTGRHKLDGGGDNSKVLCVRIIRYLVMGWSVAVISPKLGTIASPAVLSLLLAGGFLCTFGVLVFVQDWMEFHLPIWHMMIQAASICFYTVNYLYLVGSHGADLNAFAL